MSALKSRNQEIAEMGFMRFFLQAWGDCKTMAGPNWPDVNRFGTYQRIKASYMLAIAKAKGGAK